MARGKQQGHSRTVNLVNLVTFERRTEYVVVGSPESSKGQSSEDMVVLVHIAWCVGHHGWSPRQVV